jgi:hypothetical protein
VEVALQQLTTPSALLTPRTHAVGELAKDYSCVVRNSVSCTACVCVLIVPCVVDRLVSIVLLINTECLSLTLLFMVGMGHGGGSPTAGHTISSPHYAHARRR